MISPKGAPKKTTVLILHRAPVTRLGLATLIGDCNGFAPCGGTGDVPRARELFAHHKPALVVLDLALDHGDGIELIKDFRKLNAASRTLVFTSREDALSVERACKAGARGYLMAHDDTAEILRALEAVLAGEIYASANIPRRLLQSMTVKNGVRPPRTSKLSDRELQILRLIGSGFGASRLAAELHVSVKTIETHRNRIKNKLGLRSGAELNAQAMHWLEEASRERVARLAEATGRNGTG